MTTGHRLCIISMTSVTDEPRVLRQSHALAEAGWEVTVVGYPGRQTVPPWWSHYVALSRLEGLPRETLPEKVVFRSLEYAASSFTWPAELHYWLNNRRLMTKMVQQMKKAVIRRYDLITAHDAFLTGPLAGALTGRRSGGYVVDCHEFTPEQFMESITWKRRIRPINIALERRYLPSAAAVTVVSDTLADYMKRFYSLRCRPVPIHSFPFYEKTAYRPTSLPITFLYHGFIQPRQGLEETLASLPYWKDDRRLLIRGPGPPNFIQEIRNRIDRLGVSSRVTLEEPVPASQMVSTANRTADVGFYVLSDVSLQNRYRLPNKLFEYIMAGLALCISDLPDMARIVRQYDLGTLVPGTAPEVIAAAVNGMNLEQIDVCKRRSLEAARELCWEREAPRLVEVYEKALAMTRKR